MNKVPGLEKVIQISAGSYHNLVLTGIRVDSPLNSAQPAMSYIRGGTEKTGD
jgi:hypothetical protein